MYKPAVGIYIVRDTFIHNFGPTLAWWTVILMELATLVVIDLAVQSIRRVYFPTDVDLMQRIEKDAAKATKNKSATAEKGQIDGVELEHMGNSLAADDAQEQPGSPHYHQRQEDWNADTDYYYNNTDSQPPTRPHHASNDTPIGHAY